ncbi:E3 ubiquitin- ligase RNF213 [Pelobates cultripes]|uniref:RING-type E3 ubiquitin transferase n=1 Tax=Pelobates cultripes TaxID=61616 RepID=A0AAD1S7H6_PELCU|nr:E3 ubiquitin- ligase RNF213 [Pelobates cultripes]
MKCVQCKHVSQDVSPKFCSECGHRMAPPDPSTPLQGELNANLLSLSAMEVESGNELITNEASSSQSSLSGQLVDVRTDEPKPLEDGFPSQSKKKKKKKKKNNSIVGLDSGDSLMSDLSSMENVSLDQNVGNDGQGDENANLPSLSEMEMESAQELISDPLPSSNAPRISRPATNVLVREPASLDESLNAPPSKKKKSRKKNKNRDTNNPEGSQPPSPSLPGLESLSISVIPENKNEAGQQLVSCELPQAPESVGLLPPGQSDRPDPDGNLEKPHPSDESKNDVLMTKEDKDGKPAEREGSLEKPTNNEKDIDQKSEESNDCIATGSNKNELAEKTEDKAKSDTNVPKGQARGETQNKKRQSNERDTETTKKVSDNPKQADNVNKGKPNKENENKAKKGQSLSKANEGKESIETHVKSEAKSQSGKQVVKENETSESDASDTVTSKSTNVTREETNITKTGKGKDSKNKPQQNKTVDSEMDKSSPSDNENLSKQKETQSDEQRTTGSKDQQGPRTRSSDPAHYISVYFHVIVSNDFKIKPDEDKVVVRAERISQYSNWKDNVCEMNFTRNLDHHGFLYEGCAKLHKSNIDKNIPYKYVVMRKGKELEYEYIYYVDSQDRSHVNRCLNLPPRLTTEREWHQYDDICMKEDKSFFKKIKEAGKNLMGLVSDQYKNIYKAKEIAGEVMLDSIFSILSTCDSINLSSFFNQLHQFYFVYTNPLLFGKYLIKWTALEFGEKQVKELILKMLVKVCQPFLPEEKSQVNAIIPNRLLAGLVCLLVIQSYRINPIKDHLARLCCVLCLEEKSREHLLDELENAKGVFSDIPGMNMLLREFCQSCIDKDVEQWIWVLPLLHKFSSLCEQGDSTVTTKNIQEDVWAGLEGLAYEKSINRYKSDLFQLMINKKHLLQTDRTLIRSWLCLVPMEEMNKLLDQIPVTILDALRSFCFKFPKANLSAKQKAEDILKSLLKLIQDLKDKIPSKDILLSCCDASLQLHTVICADFVKLYDSPVLSAGIFLNIIRKAGQQETCSEQELNAESPDIEHALQRALQLTRKWFQESFPFKLKLYGTSIDYELNAWSRFLYAGEGVSLKWEEYLLSDLCRKIKQVDPIDQIKLYCSSQNTFKEIHPSVGKSFENCAIEAVHNACQSQRDILTQLDEGNLANFRRLVSAIIVNSWPKDDKEEPIEDFDMILKHLMEWKDATYIFKLFGTNSISQEAEVIQELVGLSDSIFLNAVDSLLFGDVQIKRLECILNNEKQFLSICKLKSDKNEVISVANVKTVLEWRRKELQSLKQEQQNVDCLLKMCERIKEFIPVNTCDIEKTHHENVGPKSLNQLLPIKRLDSQNEPNDAFSYYNLSPQVMVMAENMNRFKQSHILIISWVKEAQQFEDSPSAYLSDEEEMEDDEDQELTLKNLEKKLFTPCFQTYKKLYESIKSGEVTFEDLDRYLKDFKKRYVELQEELRTMCHLSSRDRGQWIAERVKQIEQYDQLNDAFKSAQIIDQLKAFLQLTGDFRTLDTLLQFGGDFESYKQNPLSCISDEVMKAKRILAEMKEEQAECLQEVIERKDFFNWVKEALEDVNELKVFVDLASISAGENDMDVDRVACFHDAVLGYSSILYELKPDFGFDRLMQCLKKLWKALDSDRNLPKKLRDSARHIEWLKTVKESHGSVELSSLSLATTINKNGIYIIQAPKENKKVTADSVVRLNLPEDNDDGNLRSYNLEELKELLNKLMLMSGKGEQGKVEVERFSEVFSNVQRLASSFIDLYLAGNILFRTWEATIFCSDDAKAGVRMTFNVTGIDDLEAHGTLTELLPDICKTMEHMLKEWIDFMNKERSQLYYLNYYSSEQLVYLCQQFQKRKDMNEEALVMLSFIKRNCSKMDTVKALYYPKTSSEKPSIALSRPDKMAFAMKLQKCENLLEKLGVVWDFFMKYMSSLFPDCLDIDQLGNCLASLADSEERPIIREFHPSLQKGRPNLVLCPSSDILSTAIAIYMQSLDQPLPSYDEVLLCTAQTTFEEVALFFRRCLTPGYKGKKIYCLLFADELGYDTAYRSEQLYQQLLSQGIQDYHLVIVCNSDREHCYIPSVFSQYKVHMIPQRPLADIQDYLKRHFAVGSEVISGASCFKNGMSVGIVASKRAGVGKSLYVKRLHKNLQTKYPSKRPILKTIRLIKPEVDENKVLQTFLPFLRSEHKDQPIIFHIDITSSVNSGISEFLFKLLVLQYLVESDGKIWRRQPYQLYIIEILESPSLLAKNQPRSIIHARQNMFIDFFPKISCCSPKDVLARITEKHSNVGQEDPGMDIVEFCSECFQRPFQYLIRFEQNQNLDTFRYIEGSVEGSPERCLQIFLLNCGMMDPSWSELRNFTWFLNIQLKDCEYSIFCNPELVGDTLQGFKNFVVNFMILMAKDFATPSLHIADQSPGRQTFNLRGIREEDLAPFLLRKTWESEPHPYIFFNEDRDSMTFIGFHLHPNAAGGIDAINPRNGNVIKTNVMTPQLYQGLQLQRVPFNIDFDKLPRHEKISRLSMVLGIQWPYDPDETYELTMDNILKILAVKMRFRCGIPVVIMGETGCGKTRLIKFLCHLSKGFAQTENMKLVKVHGGTSADTIYQKILEAQEFALYNTENHNCDTVLFFDEANTTDAISSIKEALCDHTVDGEPLKENSGLQIIAACNPYRKHTDEMINRLESAGLGYRVKADETKERLGSIPLRQLVYRVHALPPSMMPLVWDFGQLNDETEKKYIHQIIQRLAKDLSLSPNDIQLLTNILSSSQAYMRRRNDECSFVSLRDVERCVEVFKWFYNHSEKLLKSQKNMNIKVPRHLDKVAWCLVLAVGVCYHASLEDKESYREDICELFPEPYKNPDNILQEITNIQDLFLSGIKLRDTIARNLALKENLFMMVVCIELKIPLFLVGKPGSSKSLAKTIVADAMQGHAAHTELYKSLKQIHLVSFQCSPHSTPEGIIGTFKHCSRFQESKNLKEYVSVVVLDEIGLAEDSPKMPLKTLHPLLEDGCIEENPLPHKKVGFIGISNWALDPAKMNRGIFVSRGDPCENELIESAKGICSSDKLVLRKVEPYFPDFAKAYQTVCERQKEQNKEFFGLRDFYSLIKMVFAITRHSNMEPDADHIARAVLRNFSGKDEIKALNIFMPKSEETLSKDRINTMDLVMSNIRSDIDENECRYLLILTKNYAALQILQQAFCRTGQQPEIIFGSSFPKDQEYTQICRNINRVKMCMETGQMVVLLNLQNLYESLYDALNQYYVYLAGQKYVDLGLGTHRVKCRVHSKFRLIVIEEKEVVYKDFPIPLINRLEKHYLDINTVLNRKQKVVVKELEEWIRDFTTFNAEQLGVEPQEYTPSDVFVGYHSDTCASVILQVTENLEQNCSENKAQVKDKAKLVLLNCATPDSVIRHGNKELIEEYFKRQNHSSLLDFLGSHIHPRSGHHKSYTEITTFSRLLTSADKKLLEIGLQSQVENIEVLSLQQFDTEYSFLRKIRGFLEGSTGNQILIIQADFEEGSEGAHLVASAKYSTVNEINKVNLEDVSIFVYFITKLPRMHGGTSYVGFRGGLWRSIHIDDLRKSKDMVSDVTALQNLTISQLFQEEFDQQVGTKSEKNPGLDANEIEMIDDNETHDVMEIEPNAEKETESQEMEIDIVNESNRDIYRQAPSFNPNDILDTTILIRSCVQNAIGMLRDAENVTSRSTRRVEILIDLLSSRDQMQVSFLKMLKARLHSMLKGQEKVGYGAEEWVVREASNPNALQEAGTFRQTLWKRVQTAVTPILSHLLSIVDSDANLDNLVDPKVPDYVKSLWMSIFCNENFLNISYNRNETRSQNNTIPVKNNINLGLWNRNLMPFSWRIKDYLEGIWAQAQSITNPQDVEDKFLYIYGKGPLGQYISQLNDKDQYDVFLLYKRDFILLSMRVSSATELTLMESAFSLCIEELKPSEDIRERTLPWVHLAYHKFQHRLQTLSRILTLNPSVMEYLVQKAGEEDSMMAKGQMVVDIYATIACLEMLKDSLMTPNPQAWLRQVKNVQMPIELICSENYLQGQSQLCVPGITDIRCMWNGLFSMALFVEHVLLGNNVQGSEMKELLEVNTIYLGKALENFTDLKTIDPFMAVIDVLQRCREEVGKSTSRFGVPVCVICLEDPKEPVCLKCDHILCQSCLKQWLRPDRNICPLCKADVPENDPIVVSESIRNAIQKNVRFRQQCNAFFIDIICTLCFKDNTPPDKEVIHNLLALLFTTKESPTGQSGSRTYTKTLSPFDEAIDKTPVIRSVILKLLLKYSFYEIMVYADNYLNKIRRNTLLTSEDTMEVYLLFVNCLEDSLYEKGHVIPTQKLLKDEGDFLKDYIRNIGRHGLEDQSMHSLQEIARIRLALDMASAMFSEENGLAAIRDFLQHVKNLCTQSGNDWHRVYLIRKMASQHGIETVQKLFRDRDYRWLFPPQILRMQENQTNQIDLFLVCGNRYKCLRDGLGKALLEAGEETIVKAEEECKSPDWELSIHMVLAVFREITMQYGAQHDPNQHTVLLHDSVKNHIQDVSFLQEPTTRQFVHSLLDNSRPLLKVAPHMQGAHCAVIGLATHLAAVLLSVQNNLIGPLRNLAFFPNKMQNSYLPTMPEDLFFQFKGAVKEQLTWYVCRNGHYSAVGECGQPMQLGKCVDCNEVVGGQNHAPHAGFQRTQDNVDRTQTGHVLGNPEQRGVSVAPDRNVPAPVFIILRLVTHLAMLLGAEEDLQSTSDIVKPPVPDLRNFLLRHIARDLAQLRSTLGKSADETTTVIHLVIYRLFQTTQQQPGHWPVRFNETWSTKDGRNNWEIQMNHLIGPVLQTLNEDLRKVNEMIRNDERISSNPIVKIVYGDPLINGDPMTLPKDTRLHCSKVWSCRERISIGYLRHLVQQKNGKEAYPILWKFLEKENELKMVKFLPEILNLQKDLIKLFQNSAEANQQPIEEFLDGIRPETTQRVIKYRVEEYIFVWNHLKQSLHTNGEIKLPDDTCVDLSMSSDVSFLLPRRHGKGLCATSLVNYLITLHNSFVRAMEKFTNEEQTFSINASDVMDLHVISYNMERDLIPIILSNCQYSVQSGQGTTQEFDLCKIQRQIAGRFLQGKPLITTVGLPTYTLAHDLNYETIFMDVKKRLPQDSLPNSTVDSICRDLNVYSDVCEALRIVNVTLGFLATSEGKPEYPLSTYVEKDLQMVEESIVLILEALKRCHLKHIIAVWQLLTALKSEHLLRLKRDPFQEVDKAYKQQLNEAGQQKLNAFLEQHGSNLFLLELHEMIVLKLKKARSTDDFRPAWALRDTLGPLIEGKEIDFPELENDFPEEICLCHCVEAWKITAAKKWNRLRK